MLNYKKDNLLVNEEVNKYLETVINKGLFANGYIFFGPEGLGKQRTALQFVKRIFQKYTANDNLDKKINNNNHPDLLVIEPTYSFKSKTKQSTDSEILKKNAGVIKIDQIRNIKIFLGHKSLESEKKIVIISDAHLFNEAASNCLLKILEEPSNGIFILLTSKLDLLIDTIKSRCQQIRFKSFSCNQIESFLKENFNPIDLEIYKKCNMQDLINSSNGSLGKILNNIETWNSLSNEIKNKLDFPLNDNLEILKVSKLISDELEIHQQIFLVNLLQQIWWRKTKNINIITKLEKLHTHIKNYIQPRLAWEITLLEIASENL